MSDPDRFPPAPLPLRAALRLMPTALMAAPLNRVVREIARGRPAIFRRLGPHADRAFLLDAVDLPVVFLMRLPVEAPVVEVHRRGREIEWDVRIAGRLSALIALIHAAEDGDALFFSRDIVMEGDTGAAVALRNALDSAEIDLLQMGTESFGPIGRVAETVLRPAATALSRATGVALVRTELSGGDADPFAERDA